jgi:hypothetical protein
MRPLLLALACLAALAAGCSNNCEELGNRMCSCTIPGTTKASCKQGVKTEIGNLNPGKDVQAVCGDKLTTCNAPQDTDFCDFLAGRCGKSACGISEEDLATLQAGESPVCPP